jgi:hypothetical protein
VISLAVESAERACLLLAAVQDRLVQDFGPEELSETQAWLAQNVPLQLAVLNAAALLALLPDTALSADRRPRY